MKLFTKNEFVTEVMNLNQIINHINEENCYDKIVEFFTITSYLQDHAGEIEELLLPPVRGFKFCGFKSSYRKETEFKRAKAKVGLNKFLSELRKSGRDLYGHNRTKHGEAVSKDNIYFGDIAGINTLTVAKFERVKNDAYVQENIRAQITRFVKSYQNSFNLDWVA